MFFARRVLLPACYTRGMNTPLVYALVINWNGKEHVQACFESLLASTYPALRVALVDNGSEDGSAAFVEERYGGDERVVVWRLGRNLGWGGGNNEGIRRAMEAG